MNAGRKLNRFILYWLDWRVLGYWKWEWVHPSMDVDQPVLTGSVWVLEGPLLLLPVCIPDPGETVSSTPWCARQKWHCSLHDRNLLSVTVCLEGTKRDLEVAFNGNTLEVSAFVCSLVLCIRWTDASETTLVPSVLEGSQEIDLPSYMHVLWADNKYLCSTIHQMSVFWDGEPQLLPKCLHQSPEDSLLSTGISSQSHNGLTIALC